MEFEARHSDVPDFVLDSTLVESVDSYKNLGFVFHVSKDMKIETAFLVAAARNFNALFAMRQQCLTLGLILARCEPNACSGFIGSFFR